MDPKRLIARASLTFALGAAQTVGASEARSAITVGELTARGPEKDTPTLDLFRFLVEKELRRIELDHATRPTSYVLSASIVRLDAHASHEGASAICVVSGALRRASNGAIVAVVNGTGSVDGDRGTLTGTKARALEVAVHGAIRHLPEAI